MIFSRNVFVPCTQPIIDAVWYGMQVWQSMVIKASMAVAVIKVLKKRHYIGHRRNWMAMYKWWRGKQ
jgi:hypothetical protein